MALETGEAPQADPQLAPESAQAPSRATITPTVESTWLETLPESLRGDKTLAKYKTVGDLAQGHVNLQRMVGGRVAVPGPETSPEAIREFRARMGVPESPTGYPEAQVPEAVSWDRGAERHFHQTAHGLGLTPDQVKGVVDWYVNTYQEGSELQAQQGTQAREVAWQALRKEWGAATDRNVALVRRTIAEFGDTALAEALDSTQLGNNPAFLKFVAKVGSPLVESGFIQGATFGVDVDAEISKIMNDSKGPFYVAEHPEHAETVERLRGLYQQKYALQ